MEIKYYDGAGNLENKTIGNPDEALGFTEQLLIETRELIGKVDVTVILQQISQKVTATQDKIQQNMRLIELIISTSNGDEVSAKKLRELATTAAEEEGVEEEEEKPQKREAKKIVLDEKKKVVRPVIKKKVEEKVEKKIEVEEEDNLFV